MGYLVDIISKDTPLHMHKNYEIIVYTRGSGIFFTEDMEREVSSGEIVIVPPNTRHGGSFGGKADRMYICGEFNQIFNFDKPLVIADNSQNDGVMMAKMIYRNRHSNSEYVSALINAFAHFIVQSIKPDNEINLAVNEIMEKITNGFYDSGLDVSQLLNASGYAEDYIRSYFKRVTGKTPVEFLTEVRIKHACYLIDIYKGTMALSEIGEKCGYTDYTYFSRRFRKVMGISPRSYMKES